MSDKAVKAVAQETPSRCDVDRITLTGAESEQVGQLAKALLSEMNGEWDPHAFVHRAVRPVNCFRHDYVSIW